MMTLDEQIDYTFVAKFMSLVKKIAKQNEQILFLDELSRNPLITMNYVERHLDEPWDWEGLTENPSISVDYMKAHPEHPWDFASYHFRSLKRFDFPNIVGRWSSRNPAGIPYAWDAGNISLTEIEHCMKWIDQQADDDTGPPCPVWEEISDNPNLTLDFIEKYSNKPWKLSVLLANPLSKAQTQFKKEYKAALVIQAAYAKAKYIPTYAYCRKLHLQFYEEMFV